MDRAKPLTSLASAIIMDRHGFYLRGLYPIPGLLKNRLKNDTDIYPHNRRPIMYKSILLIASLFLFALTAMGQGSGATDTKRDQTFAHDFVLAGGAVGLGFDKSEIEVAINRGVNAAGSRLILGRQYNVIGRFDASTQKVSLRFLRARAYDESVDIGSPGIDTIAAGAFLVNATTAANLSKRTTGGRTSLYLGAFTVRSGAAASDGPATD